MSKPGNLSRRERQIMDVLYQCQEATALQVMEKLAEAPGYSAVRTFLRKLEDKGHIAHREEGLKYVYYPLVDTREAGHSAIQRLVKTFFGGSSNLAVNELLGMSMKDLSDEELDALEARIQEARRK